MDMTSFGYTPTGNVGDPLTGFHFDMPAATVVHDENGGQWEKPGIHPLPAGVAKIENK